MDLSQRMGVDWTELVIAVRVGDVEQVETWAQLELRRSFPQSHFKIVQRALEEFLFSQVRLNHPWPRFLALLWWATHLMPQTTHPQGKPFYEPHNASRLSAA